MPETIDAPVLITGGAGFFGSLLVERLLAEGEHCVVVDLQRCDKRHERLTAIKGDIRDAAMLDRLCAERGFKTVYHCAAMLAHAVQDKPSSGSPMSTARAMSPKPRRGMARARSSFSRRTASGPKTWAVPCARTTSPRPSKSTANPNGKGRGILAGHADRLHVVSIRCPTIIDEGRLGLLASIVRVHRRGPQGLGGGRRTQSLSVHLRPGFDYPLHRRGRLSGSEVFNIGSDNVETFREVYSSVIARAGTRARVASLPRRATLLAMRLAHRLGVSPLGPYQYRMIAEDFVFDTSKIKAALRNTRPICGTRRHALARLSLFRAAPRGHSRPAATSPPISRRREWASFAC